MLNEGIGHLEIKVSTELLLIPNIPRLQQTQKINKALLCRQVIVDLLTSVWTELKPTVDHSN